MTPRILVAALVDATCPHCGGLDAVRLRYRTAEAAAEADICADCLAVVAGAADLDTDARGELRRAAHHVAMRTGVADAVAAGIERQQTRPGRRRGRWEARA